MRIILVTAKIFNGNVVVIDLNRRMEVKSLPYIHSFSGNLAMPKDEMKSKGRLDITTLE